MADDGSAQSANVWPLPKFHFEVKWDAEVMSFQEVSGLDVTQKIKENEELTNIPIIAVTAFAMKGDEERIRKGGCEDYIAKPISVAGFLEKVKRYLD